jgi:hypothetical protein
MTEAGVAINYAFELGDIAIIFATLIGPVLAVQVQKLLEQRRAATDQRRQIFKILMATRAATLSPGHVEALNAVPVEFFGKDKKLTAITNKWKEYLDHHEATNLDAVWAQKRTDLFNDLLYLISQNLGYNFTRSQIARDIYSPKAHNDIEEEQTTIRRGLAQLLSGKLALPMAVTEFPATVDDNTLANQADLQKLLLQWLSGKRAVKVEQPKEDRRNGQL